MFMMRIAVALFGAACLTACGAPHGGSKSARAVRVGCEDASSQAAAPGQTSARMFAQGGLKYQIDDLKGYMLADGYRSVRVQSRRIDCRPYPLGAGLTQCIATARLCSR